MEFAPLQPTPRSAARPVQLVLVRANGPLFYSVASASLLEADMAPAAERLLHFFGADCALAQWVAAHWLPRKLARAGQLRAYVETTWPEYDWLAGQEQYRALDESAGGVARRTGAHEALARCVATAQGGVFYRSLAHWAEDRRLRELARAIAQEEAAAFAQFRRLYDLGRRRQGLSWLAAWATAFGCVRAARDRHVPRAFAAITAQCASNAAFPILEYPEFLARMGAVIERHGDLGMPERILFRTWKARPRVELARMQPRSPPGFTPVLKVA